jgi:hypothetical protein
MKRHCALRLLLQWLGPARSEWPDPSQPFGPRMKQGISPPLVRGGSPTDSGSWRQRGATGSGRGASPRGGGLDFGYGEARGSPMMAGVGGTSWAKVDTGESVAWWSRWPAQGSGRSSSSTWFWWRCRLGRGMADEGCHRWGRCGREEKLGGGSQDAPVRLTPFIDGAPAQR